MKKTYGIEGVSECVFRLPVGKAVVSCRFTDGNLLSREPQPATFTTDNPVVQAVIESCEMYQSGRVFLLASYGEPEPTAEEVKTEAEPEVKPEVAKKKKSTKTKVMENVRSYGEAVTALMTVAEVKMSEVADVEGCIRKAAELGISFPNLNKE